MRRVRVLAIDGGGIRGIIPAKVLAALETISGRRTFELFDLIVGTSIGGIAAMDLALPREDGKPDPAAEIGAFYETSGPVIFPQAPLSFPRTRDDLRELIGRVGTQAAVFGSNSELGNARYSPAGIEAALRERFADARLSQALTGVVVTAYDVRASRPVLFRSEDARRNPDEDYLMRQVGRATSAAPTAFPPLRLPGPGTAYRILIDGGIYANNPSMIGYAEAMRMAGWRGIRVKSLQIVSLGTGMPAPRTVDYEEFVTRSWFRLAEDIFLAANLGQAGLYDSLLTSLVDSHYTRFQVELPPEASFDMDDVSDRNIKALRAAGDELVQTRLDDINRLARDLQ